MIEASSPSKECMRRRLVLERHRLLEARHSESPLPFPWGREELRFAPSRPSVFYQGPRLLSVYPDGSFKLHGAGGLVYEGSAVLKNIGLMQLKLQTTILHKDSKLLAEMSQDETTFTLSWFPRHNPSSVILQHANGEIDVLEKVTNQNELAFLKSTRQLSISDRPTQGIVLLRTRQ
ncbi:hypothetical protein FOL47_002418 [Perkinsus chesapeaki]|uniref:Uncharacterized protein n=1 Tax=Perkinsus chesapeaki TaxID=330153 RepID=A0A7J6MDK1_PERCH|nr:hypothetical protein FOL47_002418 [Perkinsus chesapeaki]